MFHDFPCLCCCSKSRNGASQSLRAPFAFITNTNSNYSIKWKKRKSLTITKRMQIWIKKLTLMPLQLVFECKDSANRMQSKLALDWWGAACLSESKGRVIFGWFQIISRFLRRLVATELVICDKLRASTHLRVATRKDTRDLSKMKKLLPKGVIFSDFCLSLPCLW